MKYLLNNHEFDKSIPEKNWDWKIVTEDELRKMLDEWTFGVFGNGFANVGIYALREDMGHGYAQQVSISYMEDGWKVADFIVGRVFMQEEE